MHELVKLCEFTPFASAGVWAIFNPGAAARLLNRLSHRLRMELPHFLEPQWANPLHKPEEEEASRALRFGVQFAGLLLALFAFARLFS